jgi:hypothetical protein
MRRLILVASLLFLFSADAKAAGPRAYGKRGTATGTNATITFPFHPTRLCVINHDAAAGLYFDWTDGVASAVDASSNLFLPPGNIASSSQCYEFAANKSPFETFEVGVLSTAAATLYIINAYRAN